MEYFNDNAPGQELADWMQCEIDRSILAPAHYDLAQLFCPSTLTTALLLLDITAPRFTILV